MNGILPSISGIPAFALSMILAGIILWGFMRIYTKMTPYHEQELIRSGNAAAAISYSGTLIGFVLGISAAVSNSVNLFDLAIWALIAGAVQCLVFKGMLRSYPTLPQMITEGQIAPAIKLAAVSIAAGLLNAASMTY